MEKQLLIQDTLLYKMQPNGIGFETSFYIDFVIFLDRDSPLSDNGPSFDDSPMSSNASGTRLVFFRIK